MSSETNAMEGPNPLEAPSEALRSNWRWLMAAGIVIAVFGIIAMLTPVLTGISVTMLVGALLVATGAFHFIGVFRSTGWQGAVWQAVLGGVAVLGGAALLLQPVLGLVTLTLLVIGYLIGTGIVEIVMGFRLRGEPYWAWSIVSGVIGVALGAMLWAGFPSTAAWTVGVLFGANLFVTGASMVVLAYGARKPLESESADVPAGAGGV